MFRDRGKNGEGARSFRRRSRAPHARANADLTNTGEHSAPTIAAKKAANSAARWRASHHTGRIRSDIIDSTSTGMTATGWRLSLAATMDL
jgi:hypothetical protein